MIPLLLLPLLTWNASVSTLTVALSVGALFYLLFSSPRARAIAVLLPLVLAPFAVEALGLVAFSIAAVFTVRDPTCRPGPRWYPLFGVAGAHLFATFFAEWWLFLTGPASSPLLSVLLAHLVAAVWVAAVFGAVVRSSSELRAHLTRFVALVGGIVGIVAVIEWRGWEVPFLLEYRDPFFVALGRASGMLADPNALGVVAFLSIAFLLLQRRELSSVLVVISVAAWCVAGLLSGSRSFLLASGMLFLWSFPRSALGLGMLTFFLRDLPFIAAVPALHRVLASLDPATMAESWHSRIVFWGIAFDAIGFSPLTGVGLGRFPEFALAASFERGLGLMAWRDNANSSYLDLLAEGGVVLAAAVVFIGYRVALTTNTAARGIALALVLLFGVGAHHHSVQVMVMLGVLSGVLLVPHPAVPVSHLWGIPLTLLVSILIIRAVSFDRGLFPLEHVEGKFFRWTGARAIVHSRDSLTVRNGNPQQSQEVRVSCGEAESKVILLPGESHAVSCLSKLVAVEVFPLWSPREVLGGGDTRHLGVQVWGLIPLFPRSGY